MFVQHKFRKIEFIIYYIYYIYSVYIYFESKLQFGPLMKLFGAPLSSFTTPIICMAQKSTREQYAIHFVN